MEGWLATAFPDFQVLDGYFDHSILVLRIASKSRGNHCPLLSPEIGLDNLPNP
jgi:hypothetical protein